MSEWLLLVKTHTCLENLSAAKVAKKWQLLFPGIILLSPDMNNLSQVFAEPFTLLQHRN